RSTPTATPTGTTTPRPTARPTRAGPSRPAGAGARGSRGGLGSGFAGGGRGAGSCGSGRLTQAQAAAQVVQAEVTLAQARRALSGTTLTAPIGGVVLSVAGRVGSQVSGPGAAGFVTLGDLNELQVVADFSQTDVAKLRLGQRATISLATRPGGAYPAKVTHIDAAATTSGNLVQYGVRLAFDDQPPGLLVGQSAAAQVVTAAEADTMYVPSAALRPGAGGTFTVQVESDSGVATRTVRVGIRSDRYAEILAGLDPGDRVVLTPASGATPDSGFPGA
ncbi:MAG TPA: efflux RND transporter periplasmic adaptor subunit, partial [Streptosporangiaceae bacterium]